MRSVKASVRCVVGSESTGSLDDTRLALLSCLFAQQMGERWLLSVDGNAEIGASDREAVLRWDLAWLGVRRAEILGAEACNLSEGRGREDLYRHAAVRLLDEGYAYIQRDDALLHTDDGFAVYFCMAGRETTRIHDLLRGEVRVMSTALSDFVVYRAVDGALSEGWAAGCLASAVHDAANGVSHLFRFESDLVDSARQALLAEALGYSAPVFAHLSPLPTSVDGDTANAGLSLTCLRQDGYLPEAILAWLMSADWAGEGALFCVDELASRFELNNLRLKPLPLYTKHLTKLGRRAMAMASVERLSALVRPRLQSVYGRWHSAEGTAYSAEDWYRLLVSKMQQEVSTLDELVALSRFAYVERIIDRAAEAREALSGEWVRPVLERCYETLRQDDVSPPDRAALYLQGLRHYFRDRCGWRGRQVMYPIRAALTGSLVGPCLGCIVSLLGLRRSRQRIEDTLI